MSGDKSFLPGLVLDDDRSAGSGPGSHGEDDHSGHSIGGRPRNSAGWKLGCSSKSPNQRSGSPGIAPQLGVVVKTYDMGEGPSASGDRSNDRSNVHTAGDAHSHMRQQKLK